MKMNEKLSFWEIREWFSNVDFTIIGSGIVGLNCALNLKNKFPKSKILVLEKGILPQGASTKNAGFACFGSLSEIIDDLSKMDEATVFDLVKNRWNGLQLLRQTLGDENIGFQQNGGFELFLNHQQDLFENCKSKIDQINEFLKPIFHENVYQFISNDLGFHGIHNQLAFSPFEGQIDTGKMMISLLKKVQNAGVLILNQTEVKSFSDKDSGVEVELNEIVFNTKKLFVATNGFSKKLLNLNIKPARAQVLITQPIENLHIKGIFHLDEGFYYFRNIENRVLFGGGRNLDFAGEETTEIGLTSLIQNKLDEILQNVILPNQKVEIEHRWSGIMGFNENKKPEIKSISKNVNCAVGLGGIGIAIGTLVGKKLAELA